MSIRKQLVLCIFPVILLAGFLFPRQAPAEAAAGEILAEKVDPSVLAAGDRVVLVHNASRTAVSVNPSGGNKLAPIEVAMAGTATREVLTAIPQEAAVFELISAGDGDFYLRCAGGYLTASIAGSDLYYASAPEECSVWRFTDGLFLYNPNACFVNDTGSYHNYYLEYYNDAFTVYSKRASGNPGPYIFSFYRMGNSSPEEQILDDTLYTLPVFETSDIHGYLADTSGDTVKYLYANIADRINGERNGRPDRAVLLDGGDIYQGHTMSNLLRGAPLSAAFAAMEYDAVTIGNHEFDWGIENTVDADGTMIDYDLGGYSGVNSVPVIISNLYKNGSKVSFGRDYIILDKTAADPDGHELPVKVGVIGLAGDYGSGIKAENFAGAGYSIQLDYGAVNALAENLEQSGACDATILLVHEDAAEITAGLPEDTVIDLVLGGHTHQNINGVTSFGLPYIEPACNSKAFVRAELAFSVVEGSPVFRKVADARIISAKALPNDAENMSQLDQSIAALTDDALDLISVVMNRQIGYITLPAFRYVYLPDSGERATTCGNWLASIIARTVDAEVAFVNSGSLRSDFTIEEGKDRREITLSDIYIMFPFGNRIYRYDLTYEELLTVLTYALNPDGKTLLTQMTGIDCYFTGETVDAIVRPDGQVIYAHGEWAEGWKDRKIRVAVSDYIATTDRQNKAGLPNPFVRWAETERLIESDQTDNVAAADVLSAEAEANGGLLTIDTRPHFINLPYPAVQPDAE